MSHSLQCQCGHVRGQLNHPEKSARIRCYCKDCQAFAHYLGKAAEMLDAQGGSDIAVSHPQQIVFTNGADALACVSLSAAGMLRWFTSCCNTPIGNTARDKKMAFIGLSTLCLAGGSASVDSTLGPVRMKSCTESANGKVAGSGIVALPVLFGFGTKLLHARLSGSWRRNPFFQPGSDEPVVQPTLLDDKETERLKAIAGRSGRTGHTIRPQKSRPVGRLFD